MRTAERLQPYGVTTQEAELLEWVRGAHASGFKLAVERESSWFTVRLWTSVDDESTVASAATFDEAWQMQKTVNQRALAIRPHIVPSS